MLVILLSRGIASEETWSGGVAKRKERSRKNATQKKTSQQADLETHLRGLEKESESEQPERRLCVGRTLSRGRANRSTEDPGM